mgnify:CR=1 FL=1|jgi:C4-dicarboxylate transporter DctM subunit
MNAFLSSGILLAALLGVPLFLVILAGAALGFHSSDIDLMVLPIELYRLTESSVLMALPLFAFAGFLLGEAKTADRLVRVSMAALGWMPGGMMIIGLMTCAFFTMLTGGSGVTIVALGALLLPALRAAGYPEPFSLGLITTSGSLGLLLPPAIPLLLYGIIAQQMDIVAVDVADLFIAGIVPALIMILALYFYGLWANRRAPAPTQKFIPKELWLAFLESKWELGIPVLVLGGVLSGWLVLSEAAAATALYVLIIEVFVYKDIKFGQLVGIMRKSMVMVGGILLILGVALSFTNFLVDAQVPEKIFDMVLDLFQSKWSFLLFLNVFLLALGAILDIFAALIIMVPLILPVALHYGVDPVHLGIIFVANMQIGYFTPPVGMNLFIASYRFNKPISELYVATLPFMVVLMLVVLLITYVPQLSLWLID